MIVPASLSERQLGCQASTKLKTIIKEARIEEIFMFDFLYA